MGIIALLATQATSIVLFQRAVLRECNHRLAVLTLNSRRSLRPHPRLRRRPVPLRPLLLRLPAPP